MAVGEHILGEPWQVQYLQLASFIYQNQNSAGVDRHKSSAVRSLLLLSLCVFEMITPALQTTFVAYCRQNQHQEKRNL